jgi:hypothetical protein
MQRLNFGRIEELRILDGEPLFDPPPLAIREHKFARGDGPRPEAAKADFALKAEVVDLFAQLEAMGDGVITRKISKLIRHRTTGLRDFRCEAFSIDKPAGNDDDAVPVRGDCVLEDINDPAGASQVPREVEASELAEATQRVISGLPRDLRRLCELLQRGTLADAARELGVPRSTLRYQLPRLRELFESAGLRSYL